VHITIVKVCLFAVLLLANASILLYMNNREVNDMPKESLTLRIDSELREIFATIARDEERSLNRQIEMVLREWVKMKEQLHPTFAADIKEAISGLKAGEKEPVWKG
jgi:hypothetical protein